MAGVDLAITGFEERVAREHEKSRGNENYQSLAPRLTGELKQETVQALRATRVSGSRGDEQEAGDRRKAESARDDSDRGR